MAGSRRHDLALPLAVPVAELLPELARRAGLPDDLEAHVVQRLVSAAGRELAPGSGLGEQGIVDGAVLALVPADVARPRVHDDVAEAMCDVVETQLRTRVPVSGRRTTLAAALVVLPLGAVALLVGASPRAVAAALVALCLASAVVLLARVRIEPAAAVGVAWTGCAWAAVAGLLTAPPDGPLVGVPLVLAGAGSLVVGLVATVALVEARVLVAPPGVVGALMMVSGLVAEVGDLPGSLVLTSGLVLVVMAGSLLPGLALAVISTDVDHLVTVGDVTADPDEVDVRQVEADARTAHQLLLAGSASIGLLDVVVTPVAVSLGPWGTLVALVSGLVLLLRGRQHRVGPEVLLGRVSGMAGLVAAGISVVVLHPGWRTPAAAVMVLVGGVLLLAAVLSTAPSVRRAWLADVIETAALVSLPPLLVMATGAFAAVRS